MKSTASALLFLFALFTPAAQSQTITAESIINYFGTWKMISFESAIPGNAPSSYVTEKMAEQQIGKRFSITPDRASIETGLLGSKSDICMSPDYQRQWEDDFLGSSWQALLPTGHRLSRTAGLLFFDVLCHEDVFLGFEVVNDDQLSIFYHGYFFLFVRSANK